MDYFLRTDAIVEAIKKLREHKQKNAKSKVYNFIKKNKIIIIEADYSNNELANEIRSECGLHRSDRFILADFIKEGINTVYSTDGEFIDVANKYGIDARRFHHIEEKNVNKKIKDFFRSYYRRS